MDNINKIGNDNKRYKKNIIKLYASIGIIGIAGGTCIYKMENKNRIYREKQCTSLPSAVRLYDLDKDGKIDFIEARKLEDELLKQ